jgi:hypothetical protein
LQNAKFCSTFFAIYLIVFLLFLSLSLSLCLGTGIKKVDMVHYFNRGAVAEINAGAFGFSFLFNLIMTANTDQRDPALGADAPYRIAFRLNDRVPMLNTFRGHYCIRKTQLEAPPELNMPPNSTVEGSEITFTVASELCGPIPAFIKRKMGNLVVEIAVGELVKYLESPSFAAEQALRPVPEMVKPRKKLSVPGRGGAGRRGISGPSMRLPRFSQLPSIPIPQLPSVRLPNVPHVHFRLPTFGTMLAAEALKMRFEQVMAAIVAIPLVAASPLTALGAQSSEKDSRDKMRLPSLDETETGVELTGANSAVSMCCSVSHTVTEITSRRFPTDDYDGSGETCARVVSSAKG